MELHPYARLSVEGDKKTRWVCCCFEKVDSFFKFCSEHNDSLRKAIESQIDELDMTIIVDEKKSEGLST